MISNNYIRIIIEWDEKWKLSIFEKLNEEISSFVKEQTRLILFLEIKKWLFLKINRKRWEEKEKELEKLLKDNEFDIIHIKPWIWNK